MHQLSCLSTHIHFRSNWLTCPVWLSLWETFLQVPTIADDHPKRGLPMLCRHKYVTCFVSEAGVSLVPRPCTFVACSTKFAQNFVLEATNAQSLGTRLGRGGVETIPSSSWSSRVSVSQRLDGRSSAIVGAWGRWSAHKESQTGLNNQR